MGLFSRNPKISALETKVTNAREDQKAYERSQRLSGHDQSHGIRLQQELIDRALDELHTEQEIEKYRAKD
ncbi:hypothetical protein [Streptomyces europaeiscabiei]|uniref:hypothetical protein n=1 Tax=Streptomyces europaeiscabiei TaxID=146819 RepID=UPI0029AA50F9|nr:hypothetical protein [Streptomyces europaeiscabiei]MDX3835621.1 hypothetical protein [Streptomyces europaeiscabiei]